MAKVLDFNAIETPVLSLVMRDKEKTNIDVTTPPEKLISEMLSMSRGVERIVNSGDANMYESMYDLAARLISFNTNGITVTAEELLNKYGIDMAALIKFFQAYASFVTEIANSKN